MGDQVPVRLGCSSSSKLAESLTGSTAMGVESIDGGDMGKGDGRDGGI